jgi:hypothetical protein
MISSARRVGLSLFQEEPGLFKGVIRAGQLVNWDMRGRNFRYGVDNRD